MVWVEAGSLLAGGLETSCHFILPDVHQPGLCKVEQAFNAAGGTVRALGRGAPWMSGRALVILHAIRLNAGCTAS